MPALIAAAAPSGADAVHPGYGFLSERAALAAGLREGRPRVRRSAGRRDRAHGIEDRRARADAAPPACRSCPARRRAISPTTACSPPRAASAIRCSSRPRPAAAARACASCAHDGEAAGVDRGGAARGDGRVRRRHALRRAADRAAAPRRDPDLRRRARQRRPSLRARVLGPAAAPEGRSRRARRRRVTPPFAQRMGDAAVAAARAAGYRNAGTIEFLLEGEGDERAVLLSRDEHAAPGRASGHRGRDRRRSRARAARRRRRRAAAVDAGRRSSQRGHAIECRVYAEDPAHGFLPQAGPLLLYREPSGPGIRVDSGVTEGDRVGVNYDPLLAKLIVHARDARGGARARRARAAQLSGARHAHQHPVPHPAARAAGLPRRPPAHRLHRGASRRARRSRTMCRRRRSPPRRSRPRRVRRRTRDATARPGRQRPVVDAAAVGTVTRCRAAPSR